MATRSQRTRRGSSATQLVLMFPMVLSAGALAVDGSYFYTVHSGAQAVADAATLAASSTLTDDREARTGLTRARQTVSANAIYGETFSVRDDGVEYGVWDMDASTFTPARALDASVNAVRVSVESTPIEPVFASVLGLRAPAAKAQSIAVAISGDGSVEGCGMLSDGSYDVHGNPMIDSYELAKGTYDPVTNAGRHGNSCSNGDYVVRGNVDVRGVIGYGGSFTERGGAASYDSKFEMGGDVEVEPVDCSDAKLRNNNASLTVERTKGHRTSVEPVIVDGEFEAKNGETIVFPAGTYYLTGFSVTANTDIVIDGEVTICVDGDVDFRARSFTNTSEDPRKFVVQVDSTDGYPASGDVTFHANTATHAVVYAPASDIDFRGNSDFYGVVIGYDVDHQGNAKVHVPQELAGELAPIPSVTEVRLVQ